jgi:hypothetical protein
VSNEAPARITVARCYDIHEATRIKLALELHGIPALIPDEISGTLEPFLGITANGIRVQVGAHQVAEAEGIVAEVRNG